MSFCNEGAHAAASKHDNMSTVRAPCIIQFACSTLRLVFGLQTYPLLYHSRLKAQLEGCTEQLPVKGVHFGKFNANDSQTNKVSTTHLGSDLAMVPWSQISARVAPPTIASLLTSTAKARSRSLACMTRSSRSSVLLMMTEPGPMLWCSLLLACIKAKPCIATHAAEMLAAQSIVDAIHNSTRKVQWKSLGPVL